jgi:hypothetical protein
MLNTIDAIAYEVPRIRTRSETPLGYELKLPIRINFPLAGNQLSMMQTTPGQPVP